MSLLIHRGPQTGSETNVTIWFGRPLAVSSPKTNSTIGFQASLPRMLSTIRPPACTSPRVNGTGASMTYQLAVAFSRSDWEVSSISSRRMRFSPVNTSSWMALSVPESSVDHWV